MSQLLQEYRTHLLTFTAVLHKFVFKVTIGCKVKACILHYVLIYTRHTQDGLTTCPSVRTSKQSIKCSN